MTDFEALYHAAVDSLSAYIRTHPDDEPSKDSLHHLQQNKEYYRYQHERGHVYTCACCGTLDCATHHTQPTQSEMLATKTCFTCHLWELRATLPDPRWIIVDGVLYKDAGDNSNKAHHLLGHSGRRWYIRKGNAAWTTNNLWCAGIVPARWAARLPDNAQFLTSKEYNKLTKE